LLQLKVIAEPWSELQLLVDNGEALRNWRKNLLVALQGTNCVV